MYRVMVNLLVTMTGLSLITTGIVINITNSKRSVGGVHAVGVTWGRG